MRNDALAGAHLHSIADCAQADRSCLADDSSQHAASHSELTKFASCSDFLQSLLESTQLVDDEVLLRDTLATLLFGATDEIQNSIVWGLYEISHHPEWEEKMRQEAIQSQPSDSLLKYRDINVRINSNCTF